MATIIKHYAVRILTLEAGDIISALCKAGDIVLDEDDDGWWTRFINEVGDVESYDLPFATYNEALWTAKAAAEFQTELGWD
jgi:hypothetical protein